MNLNLKLISKALSFELSNVQKTAILFCLINGSTLCAQDQTINGSLDVVAGPITLGTANVWDGTGTWDPTSPTLISATGLTISFHEDGAWDAGDPGLDITATFTDPDGTPYSGDEYWYWTDDSAVYQTYSGNYLIDAYSNLVDGYSQSTLTIVHRDPAPVSYHLGTAQIKFSSSKPQTVFRWQVAQPDGSGSFMPQNLMELSTSNGLTVQGEIISMGNISGSASNNILSAQTITGSHSIMTAGLSDARYLRKDSTVFVSGSYAGGIGMNLISAGTQFVTGKNNSLDNTALFVVGSGTSNSNRKNALTVSSAGNTTVNGALGVTGATTLSGTLSVTGTTTLQNLSAASTTLQNLSAASSTVSGNSSVGGNLTVTGTVSIGGQTVLTPTVGDVRYLRKDSTVSVTGPFAGGIGQNLIANGTQFVSGKNNVSDSAALFIVGSGSTTSVRKNAFSISSAGNTTINGTLTATGASALNAGLTVAGGTTSVQAFTGTTGSFNGNVDVTGTLTASGAILANGSKPVLTVDDLATLQASLTAVNTAVTNLVTSVSTGYVAKSSDTLAIGTNAVAGGGGFAIGGQSMAADYAISIGSWSGNNGYLASGVSSISLGLAAKGWGERGIALGSYSMALGVDSIAMGYLSTAQSNKSVAIGHHLEADKWGQTVIGTFNAYSAATNSPLPEDSIFVIGNGTSDTERSNAFVIKRNGNTEVKGSLTVQGQRDPSEPNPTTTTKVIPKSGQMILVPEQGDISMGDFRAGDLPVAE